MTDKKGQDDHGHERTVAKSGDDVSNDANKPPFAPPERDTLLVWMSALCDGELDAEKEAILVVAMEKDPALFAEFAAMAQVLPGGEPPVDMTDIVMASIDAAEVSDARLLMSQAMDGALDAAGHAQLQTLLKGARTDAAQFWYASEALSQVVEAEVEAAPAGLAEGALSVVDADARAAQLFSALLDGEATDTEADEYVGLLSAAQTAHADLMFRQRDLVAMARTTELTHALVTAPQSHPEAQRAGQAAIAAILVAEENAASSGAKRLPAVESVGFMERLRRAFAPLAVAGAAAAAFFFIAQPGDGDLNPDGIVFSPDVDDLRTLAMADSFDVLDDNGADVQALEAGEGAAMIFNTEASNITVIWVTDPNDDIEGT